MSEYKSKIALFAAIAVVAAVGLAAVISVFPTGGNTGTTSSPQTLGSSTFQATTTNEVGVTTQTDFFNLQGPIPLVTLGPQNSSFALTYSARSLKAANLTFSLSESYMNVYTNGTQWVSYSRPCASSSSTSTSSQPTGSMSNVTVITITETAVPIPCGLPPNSGWGPTNGTVVDRYVKLTSSEISVAVQPSTISANQTVNLRATVSLHLKPGVYELDVFFGVESSSPFEYESSWFPVIVNP